MLHCNIQSVCFNGLILGTMYRKTCTSNGRIDCFQWSCCPENPLKLIKNQQNPSKTFVKPIKTHQKPFRNYQKPSETIKNSSKFSASILPEAPPGAEFSASSRASSRAGPGLPGWAHPAQDALCRSWNAAWRWPLSAVGCWDVLGVALEVEDL